MQSIGILVTTWGDQGIRSHCQGQTQGQDCNAPSQETTVVSVKGERVPRGYRGARHRKGEPRKAGRWGVGTLAHQDAGTGPWKGAERAGGDGAVMCVL